MRRAIITRQPGSDPVLVVRDDAEIIVEMPLTPMQVLWLTVDGSDKALSRMEEIRREGGGESAE